MSKLYSLFIHFCLCMILAVVTSRAAYAQADNMQNSVWKKSDELKSHSSSVNSAKDEKLNSSASKPAIAETDKKLPNIVFGNNFTREIDKIRIQAEKQGEGTSGDALVSQKRKKRSLKAVCLDTETCNSVNAEAEAGTSLDVSFDDDDDYIAPRVDGGIPKDQSTSAVGLQRNFRNNWNVTGAATFKRRGRGGAAAIGYKW